MTTALSRSLKRTAPLALSAALIAGCSFWASDPLALDPTIRSDWYAADQTGTRASYQAFLDKHPGNPLSGLARQRINGLGAEESFDAIALGQKDPLPTPVSTIPDSSPFKPVDLGAASGTATTAAAAPAPTPPPAPVTAPGEIRQNVLLDDISDRIEPFFWQDLVSPYALAGSDADKLTFNEAVGRGESRQAAFTRQAGNRSVTVRKQVVNGQVVAAGVFAKTGVVSAEQATQEIYGTHVLTVRTLSDYPSNSATQFNVVVIGDGKTEQDGYRYVGGERWTRLSFE